MLVFSSRGLNAAAGWWTLRREVSVIPPQFVSWAHSSSLRWSVQRVRSCTKHSLPFLMSLVTADHSTGPRFMDGKVISITISLTSAGSSSAWAFQAHRLTRLLRTTLTSAHSIKAIRPMESEYSSYSTEKIIWSFSDARYLILPPYLWQEIWNTTGLSKGNKKWRREIFDCDDFALGKRYEFSTVPFWRSCPVMKSAIAEWGADKWRADVS